MEISATTVATTPIFSRAPRIRPHGNARYYVYHHDIVSEWFPSGCEQRVIVVILNKGTYRSDSTHDLGRVAERHARKPAKGIVLQHKGSLLIGRTEGWRVEGDVEEGDTKRGREYGDSTIRPSFMHACMHA